MAIRPYINILSIKLLPECFAPTNALWFTRGENCCKDWIANSTAKGIAIAMAPPRRFANAQKPYSNPTFHRIKDYGSEKVSHHWTD